MISPNNTVLVLLEAQDTENRLVLLQTSIAVRKLKLRESDGDMNATAVSSFPFMNLFNSLINTEE